jgi:hypothetical protein
MVIDSQRADRTTKQHGIAWWVNRRLVGQCGWRLSDQEKVLDGRSEEAKRYTFIVQADLLAPAVLADWSDFKTDSELWHATQSAVQDAVRDVLVGITKEKRTKAKDLVRSVHRQVVSDLPLLSRERWNQFLNEIVERCPSLSSTQIEQVMGLLANLELAESQYSLLAKLHTLRPTELDDWNDVLEKWTINSAKVALDEVEKRLRLLEEIRAKTSTSDTDEVQELQPLFGRALWIFGPQYESIEFTSNRGMTTVIKKLFDGLQTGSRNRPDFACTPDSTIGFYARPSFDTQANENGTEVLIIVELKKPGVPLGTDEKGQVWKYVRELMQKGYVTDRTTVYGYVLGDSIDPTETGERKEGDRTFIRPMLYSSFIGQGEKRMMNLHKRLTEAPFMQQVLSDDAKTVQPTRKASELPLHLPSGSPAPVSAQS